jgi:hypothetical protein
VSIHYNYFVPEYFLFRRNDPTYRVQGVLGRIRRHVFLLYRLFSTTDSVLLMSYLHNENLYDSRIQQNPYVSMLYSRTYDEILVESRVFTAFNDKDTTDHHHHNFIFEM